MIGIEPLETGELVTLPKREVSESPLMLNRIL